MLGSAVCTPSVRNEMECGWCAKSKGSLWPTLPRGHLSPSVSISLDLPATEIIRARPQISKIIAGLRSSMLRNDSQTMCSLSKATPRGLHVSQYPHLLDGNSTRMSPEGRLSYHFCCSTTVSYLDQLPESPSLEGHSRARTGLQFLGFIHAVARDPYRTVPVPVRLVCEHTGMSPPHTAAARVTTSGGVGLSYIMVDDGLEQFRRPDYVGLKKTDPRPGSPLKDRKADSSHRLY
ncbi:hypothetical protein QBC46DRAFT_10941 [Diplogelasinospora grovesii]|uniref:Uncharacterized protein n=1 Tax=Diplogelasinospora grovesii TaxID=303347 RepID=A0AAN6N1E8_9PEZI|nr:hypothetical protein QBC46DRAFT_10941 [Diplogelasinospora grovesii]